VGFVVESIVENGFAEGLHEYKMVLTLTAENRRNLKDRGADSDSADWLSNLAN